MGHDDLRLRIAATETPVTPTTWSRGSPRYRRTYSCAPRVCAPSEVPGLKYSTVTIVVERSPAPGNSRAVFTTGSAPARP